MTTGTPIFFHTNRSSSKLTIKKEIEMARKGLLWNSFHATWQPPKDKDDENLLIVLLKTDPKNL